jgi:hypothetical protein
VKNEGEKLTVGIYKNELKDKIKRIKSRLNIPVNAAVNAIEEKDVSSNRIHASVRNLINSHKAHFINASFLKPIFLRTELWPLRSLECEYLEHLLKEAIITKEDFELIREIEWIKLAILETGEIGYWESGYDGQYSFQQGLKNIILTKGLIKIVISGKEIARCFKITTERYDSDTLRRIQTTVTMNGEELGVSCLMQAKNETSKKEKEIEALNNMSEEDKAELLSLQTEKIRISGLIADKDKIIAAINSEKMELKTKNDSLEGEKANIQSKNATLEEEVKEEKQMRLDLTETNSKLEQEKELLFKQNKLLQDGWDQTIEQNKKLMGLLSRKNNENDQNSEKKSQGNSKK